MSGENIGAPSDPFFAATSNAAILDEDIPPPTMSNDPPAFIDSTANYQYTPPQSDFSMGSAAPPPPPVPPTQPPLLDTSGGSADPFYDQPQEPPPPATKAFWTLRFWQQFFNVDTKDVANRCLGTVRFWTPPDFLAHKDYSYAAHQAQENNGPSAMLEAPPQPHHAEADLYGPFWICATLWIVLAVVANIARTQICDETDPSIKLDKSCEDSWFSVFGVAGGVIYGYGLFVPLALWLIMKWKDVPVGLVDTICLYGYAFTPFCVAAVLCLIPSAAVQWIVSFAACVLSMLYIVANLFGVWKQTLEKKWFLIVVIGAVICHAGLVISFNLVFFKVVTHVPDYLAPSVPSAPIPPPVAPPVSAPVSVPVAA
eukprot:TRINITY_DN76746_c0_g1_i1.p1 TRINITY_DN76746_c0_g1~~TRINITY_DN76746_c0_g1_i1.p1  ORF type:complete len:369 (-),score=47.68 TRINITY_DN76746_c0_g1_i1:77-1183(-)